MKIDMHIFSACTQYGHKFLRINCCILKTLKLVDLFWNVRGIEGSIATKHVNLCV